MRKNAPSKVMLFMVFVFLTASCSSLRNPSRPNRKVDKIDATSALRNKVSKFGQRYVGTPYRYAGKDPAGFDCSGFTSFVLSEHGVEVSSSSRMQATQGKPVELKKVKAGDLIFFGEGDKITHVAMVVAHTSEGISVVHSTTSKGVLVQNITESDYWRPKILFARDVISE